MVRGQDNSSPRPPFTLGYTQLTIASSAGQWRELWAELGDSTRIQTVSDLLCDLGWVTTLPELLLPLMSVQCLARERESVHNTLDRSFSHLQNGPYDSYLPGQL